MEGGGGGVVAADGEEVGGAEAGDADAPGVDDVAAVAAALLLRMLLTPLTGRGAPFVIFFGATLVTGDTDFEGLPDTVVVR